MTSDLYSFISFGENIIVMSIVPLGGSLIPGKKTKSKFYCDKNLKIITFFIKVTLIYTMNFRNMVTRYQIYYTTQHPPPSGSTNIQMTHSIELPPLVTTIQIVTS